MLCADSGVGVLDVPSFDGKLEKRLTERTFESAQTRILPRIQSERGYFLISTIKLNSFKVREIGRAHV